MPGLLPTDPHPSLDERWAARAIELARLADYRTSPNPMVGAVVLDRNGELVGEGYHHHAGGPHAEQEALAAAGPAAREGTLYVNLEPCAHAHRTPSCAEAVIDAGLKRVVIAMRDPDQRTCGAGIAMLEAAGLETAVGALDNPARRLNEFYIKHRSTGRPFVSAKFAMSLDGKIATKGGESRWITGDEARQHGHELRHIHDAILVGLNTVVADDPELSARLEDREARQPLRVILDSLLRTPRTARVLTGKALVATTRAGTLGATETLQLPEREDGRVAIEPLLDELGRRGILSVLVEGGAETHASFFEAGLVDKVYAYIAPRLIGGRHAPGPLGGDGIKRLADAARLRDTEWARLGDDYLISGYVDVHGDS